MCAVVLIDQLVAGEDSLIRVYDDYEIAAVNMRSKISLMLTAKKNSSLSSGATKGLVSSIKDVPLAVYLLTQEI